MNEPYDELLDHNYDGIQEYDNPTPGWWHMLFFVTILFSICYVFFYHASPMSSSILEKWDMAQVAEYERIFGDIGDLEADERTIVEMMGNEQMMAVAEGMFISTCASCHANNGSGINGVNLTDDVYKNADTLVAMYDVITDGAAMGAMPAWRTRFNQNQRVLLAAYAASMRGQNLPGRVPEGEPIAPWPTLEEAAAGGG